MLRRAELPFSTSDDTGLMTSGIVQMKGLLIPASPFNPSRTLDDGNFFVVSGETVSLRLYFDHFTWNHSLFKTEQQASGIPIHGASDVIKTTREILHLRLLRTPPMYLFPLVSGQRDCTVGLMLVPNGCERGKSVGIGMYDTYMPKDKANIMKGALQPLDPELYEEDLGGGQYVFSIV